VAREGVTALPVEGLTRAVALLDENAARLSNYLTNDAVGRKLPDYLRKLSGTLAEEKRGILANIDRLSEHLEHMKKIIAAQQSYAKVTGVTEVCRLDEIAESAIAINQGALRSSNIEVVRSYEKLPPVFVDRHQLMQILVNLITNAKHALEDVARPDRRLFVSIAKVDGGVRLEVRDNGAGIAPENLPKVFSHGFTTKKTGHGFGLHNSANAAQQMDGGLTAHSDGPGQGATFVLRMPVQFDEQPAEGGVVAAGQGA
jgi:signal transduction histidine kinase